MMPRAQESRFVGRVRLMMAILTIVAIAALVPLQAAPGGQRPVVLGTPALPPPGLTCSSPGPSQDAVEIPRGATAVRLCDISANQDLAVYAPPDVLIENIGRLSRTYHRLVKISHRPKDAACTAQAGPDLEFVFGYPDREPVRIKGSLAGCAEVGDRTGAGILVRAFADLLQDQRERQLPWTGSTPELDCTESQGSFVQPRISALRHGSAALCVTNQAGTWRTVPIEDADWQTLHADLTENSSVESASPEECDGLWHSIRAANSYGESLDLTLRCGVAEWARPSGQREFVRMRWILSPAANDIITGLLES